MKVLENFEFEGKNYEIRVYETEGNITVRAYCENEVANIFPHSIDRETNCDFEMTHGRSALKELVKSAKSDITNKLEEISRGWFFLKGLCFSSA